MRFVQPGDAGCEGLGKKERAPRYAEMMSDGEAARCAAIARVTKFVSTYVAKGPYELYPEPEVVRHVIEGLADNLVAHGKMYCPCAPVARSMEQGNAMVCPCVPHHADIARQGHCDCALFASSEFVEAESLTKRGRRPNR